MSDTHTRDLRPDAVLSARMAAAFKDGRDTARAGERRVNPWGGLDTDPRNRVLAQMWGRGFSEGNPMPAVPATG